ncbi:MAG TPA: hypothetical protein VGP93_11670, partial [Polyangiaceae bacterium]|nr:hypothetical protein [Polyangiaceae bacterium]
VTLLGFALLFARTAGAETWRASVLDGVLTLVLALGCILVPLPPKVAFRLSKCGLPLWLALALIAVWLSRGALGGLVGEMAPVLSPLNGW